MDKFISFTNEDKHILRITLTAEEFKFYWKNINKKNTEKVFVIEHTCLYVADICFIMWNLEFIT